jgi:hypothetical protein
VVMTVISKPGAAAASPIRSMPKIYALALTRDSGARPRNRMPRRTKPIGGRCASCHIQRGQGWPGRLRSRFGVWCRLGLPPLRVECPPCQTRRRQSPAGFGSAIISSALAPEIAEVTNSPTNSARGLAQAWTSADVAAWVAHPNCSLSQGVRRSGVIREGYGVSWGTVGMIWDGQHGCSVRPMSSSLPGGWGAAGLIAH